MTAWEGFLVRVVKVYGAHGRASAPDDGQSIMQGAGVVKGLTDHEWRRPARRSDVTWPRGR